MTSEPAFEEEAKPEMAALDGSASSEEIITDRMRELANLDSVSSPILESDVKNATRLSARRSLRRPESAMDVCRMLANYDVYFDKDSKLSQKHTDILKELDVLLEQGDKYKGDEKKLKKALENTIYSMDVDVKGITGPDMRTDEQFSYDNLDIDHDKSRKRMKYLLRIYRANLGLSIGDDGIKFADVIYGEKELNLENLVSSSQDLTDDGIDPP